MTWNLPAHSGAAASKQGAVRALIASTLAGVLVFGVMPGGLAHADELDEAKQRVKSALAKSNKELVQYSDALEAAEASVVQAREALAAAQAELAQKQRQLSAARLEDQRMARELVEAEKALAAAQQRVEQGKADLVEQQHVVGLNVQTATQQNTALEALSMLVTDMDSRDISSRLQWTTTVFNVTQAEMDRLKELQAQLEAAEAAMALAEADVRGRRELASQALDRSTELERQATAAAQTVATKLASSQQVEAAARAQVAKEEQELAQLQAEELLIQSRIQARIARQKAEAERLARERALAAKNTPAPAAAAARNPVRNAGAVREGSTRALLQRPTQGRITSPFGWRIHPVLGYSKFHTGIDLGSPCGTPVLAAESGVVEESGWSGSLGLYVVVDQGVLNGSYYSTGYGHLSRSAVQPGQRVQRGQVVAYVGTTGLSTGCHLHFNVYKNGDFVNGAALF